MYHLGLSHRDLMQMDLGELNWHFNRLIRQRESESELERIKIEAMLLAAGVKSSLSGGGRRQKKEAPPPGHRDIELVG